MTITKEAQCLLKFTIVQRGYIPTMHASVQVVFAFLVLLSAVVIEVRSQEGCADVVDASALQSDTTGTWTFIVTVSSDETGWNKYADAWEVRRVDTGEVLGTRVLAHPHVNEQPFTRQLSGVVIPDDVTEVVIAARDSVLGFCGEEFTLQLPRGVSEPTPAPQSPEPTTTSATSVEPTKLAASDMPSTEQTPESSSTTNDEATLETDALTGATSGASKALRATFLCLVLPLFYLQCYWY